MKKSRILRYLAYFTLTLIFLAFLLEGGLAAAKYTSEQEYKNQAQSTHENAGNSVMEKINDTNGSKSKNSNNGDSNSRSEKLQNNQNIQQENRTLGYEQHRARVREELQLQREEYQKAKEDFLKIKNEIRAGKIDPNSEEAFAGTKTYLDATINYMIAHLSNVKSNMEYSNGSKTEEKIAAINDKISLLEAEKAKVEEASNQKELLVVVKSLRDIWESAQKVSLAGAGQIVSEKIGEFLEKSENLSREIEGNIQSLKGNGTDTSDLEVKLTSYKSYIADAKEKKESADLLYKDTNASKEIMQKANNYLRESLNDINKANKILKQIFEKLKEYENEKVK